MIDNLNDIYDPNSVEQGPGKPPRPAPSKADAYLSLRGSLPDAMPRSGAAFNTTGVDQADIQQFMNGQGIGDPNITGEATLYDIGQRQSVWNKIGRRAANLVPNMAAGLIDLVGYTGALVSEWGDNRDYDNAINQFAQSLRDPAGTNYARNDQSTVGASLSDPTWWIDNGFGLVEFAAPFAVGGAGIGTAFGEAATGISSALRLGAQGTRIAAAIGEGAAAGMLAYSEAAQAGAQVFKETYNTQIGKQLAAGYDLDTARENAQHIASQSAATTVQMATIMSTALNIYSVSPYFKKAEDTARDILAREMKQLPGETTKEWGARIRNFAAATKELMPHEGWTGKAIAAANEGAEEVVQQFAQQTGTDLGKEGKTKGILEQWDQISKFVDRTANKDGILSFALGAIGGGLMEIGQQHVLPTARIDKVDSTGQPIQASEEGELKFDRAGNPVYEKAWVTPRKADEWGTLQRFTNMKDALASDIDQFNDAQARYLAAGTKGNKIEQAQALTDMFNPAQMYAIRAGITGPWMETYRQIENMPVEEAVAKGYAANPQDISYQEKAREAASDLQSYTKEYDRLQSQYGTQYNSNAGVQQLVDMLFARKIDLMSWEKNLQKADTALKEREREETVQSNNIYEFSNSLSDLFRQVQSSNVVRARLQEDLNSIQAYAEAADTKGLKRMVKKYRAVGMSDANLSSAIKDLTRKITAHNEQMNQRVKTLEDTIFASSEYTTWLEQHPGGTFEQFIQDVQKTYQLNAENLMDRANIEQSRHEYEIAQQNYNDLTKEGSISSLVGKASDWFTRLQQERAAAEQAENNEMSRRAKDKTSLTKLQKIGLNKFAERYRTAYNENRKRYDEVNEQIAKLEKESTGVSMWKDPIRKTGLLSQLRQLQNEKATLDKQGEKLQSAFQEYSVDTSTPDEEEPIEALTNENADVEEDPTSVEGGDDIYTNSDNYFDLIVDQIEREEEFPEPPPMVEDRAYEVYHQLVDHLGNIPSSVQDRLQQLEEGLSTGQIGFSYDLLNNEIAAKQITQAKAAQLLQLLKDYLDVLDLNDVNEELLKPILPDSEAQETDTAGPTPPDSPVVATLDETLPNTDEGNDNYHAGYKTVDVLSIANTTIAYTEAYDKKDRKYYKITLNTINPNTNPDILRGSALRPGTAIYFEVDTQYNGPANINDDMVLDDEGKRVLTHETFNDYIDEKGKIPTEKAWNVPIKIIDTISGRTIGYVRKLDWITAKYPGTTDYRNVVDIIEEDDTVIDNMAIQVEAIKEMRERIVNQFNTTGQATDGKINAKRSGKPIFNKDTNLNTGKSVLKTGLARSTKPENSLLPDESLTLAIIHSGQAYSGYNYQFPKSTAYDTVSLVDGSVVAMLPTANGEHIYTGLSGQRLVDGQKKSAVTTVARVIELYLLNDGINPEVTGEIIKIQQNTGFDISTEAGLRNFINQYYTYTRSFKLSDTAINAPVPPGGTATTSFEFQIWDRIGNQTKGNIKVGWTYSGRPVIEAVIRNGQLNPEFVQALEAGFASRSRGVVYTDINRGLRGINSSGTFRDALYTADGKWRFNEYPSYNEFVKSFSKTAIYGRNQLEDGTYVYTANPFIGVEITGKKDVTTIPNESATQVKQVPYTDPVTGITGKEITEEDIVGFDEDPANNRFDQGAADLFDDLIQFSFAPMTHPITSREIGTGPENSTPMTLKTLEDLYTFTPEGERNGKTVQEVFDQLSRNGQTFIAQGHNPFSRCL